MVWYGLIFRCGELSYVALMLGMAGEVRRGALWSVKEVVVWHGRWGEASQG